MSKIVTLVQKEVEQAFMGKGAEVDAVEYSMNNESTQNGMEFENAESELAEDASVLKNKLGISEALKEIKDKLDEEPDGFIRQIAAKVVEVLEEDKNAAGLKAMDTNDESIEEVVLKTGAEDSSNIREVKSSSDEKGNAGTEERLAKKHRLWLQRVLSRNLLQETVTTDSLKQFQTQAFKKQQVRLKWKKSKILSLSQRRK
ncbi:hypothetical protein [Acetivibrio straminisolvens]|uniref:hypothetical protein n=1 Tax=Acetivibrio straminisolvens TaxID=253314 RepID=UPI0004BC32B0|nr:hypothetical protein [Acetivibrio straminisolvens]